MASAESIKIYPMAVTLIVLSFISILIGIAPLILHIKNRNYAMASLIAWFCLLNIFNIINAFIWPNDDIDSWWDGTGLCDTEVKLMVAAYVAVPGALVPVFRNLAHVLDTERAVLVPTKGQRWRNRFMGILFCVVVPIISMGTDLIYQRRRYFLFGISGCATSYDRSYMSLILAYIWPSIISLIAGWYCALVLIRLHRYRKEFGNILVSANSGMSKARFLRLFLLSFVMLLAIIPTQSFMVYYNCRIVGPWHPFSWAATHGKEWNIITKVRSNGHVFFDRWIPIVGNVLVFIFFGCGKDALSLYCRLLHLPHLEHWFSGGRRAANDNLSFLAPNPTSSTGGSLSSRAKLLFRRQHSNSSVDIDCEAGLKLDRTRRPVAAWYRLPWPKTHRPDAACRVHMSPLPHLSSVSNMVRTTAWASNSVTASRSSCELILDSSFQDAQEFIRVKQVICQQSEEKP